MTGRKMIIWDNPPDYEASTCGAAVDAMRQLAEMTPEQRREAGLREPRYKESACGIVPSKRPK